MIHHLKCPLCGSDDVHQFMQVKDHFLSGELFPVSKCSSCGFVFTQDHPGEDETGRYYESADYASHSDEAKGLVNRIYRFSRNFMLGKKRRIVNKFTTLSHGNLLDIGSGSGYFLNEMKSAGWRVSGIEINDNAREFSIKKFGLEVISPDHVSTLQSAHFDCITLWHVLEHFQDPFGYASEINRMLKPHGVCIVALPNCDSFDAPHFGEFWAAYDVPRHLWHFTPDTFRHFAGKAGFEIMTTGSLPLDVFYISILSEKYKGSRLFFIKGFLKGSWFALKALFDKNRASSVIYVLKRPPCSPEGG